MLRREVDRGGWKDRHWARPREGPPPRSSMRAWWPVIGFLIGFTVMRLVLTIAGT